MTILDSAIVRNRATGGKPGGLGIGGGIYVFPTATVCLDEDSLIEKNRASTSDDDVFGLISPCE